MLAISLRNKTLGWKEIYRQSSKSIKIHIKENSFCTKFWNIWTDFCLIPDFPLIFIYHCFITCAERIRLTTMTSFSIILCKISFKFWGFNNEQTWFSLPVKVTTTISCVSWVNFLLIWFLWPLLSYGYWQLLSCVFCAL